jgi:hypothetical protein
MGEKRDLQRAERERIARLIYPYYTAAGVVPWTYIKEQTGISYDRKYCERCLNEFQNMLIQEGIERSIEEKLQARFGFSGELPPLPEPEEM